jgi:hypothetical protein
MQAAGQTPAKMMVRRIEISNAEAKKEAKRKRTENKDDGKASRQYEYVNISLVAESLVKYLRSVCRVIDKCKGHELRLFSYCVALLGSDFTTGIPKVGCVTFFKNLNLVFGPLQQAYDPTTQHFNVKAVANNVIAPLLAIVHKKHAGNAYAKNITSLLRLARMLATRFHRSQILRAL